MPAQSKAQQRFFGVVKAMQKGDKPKKGEAGKVAKSMKKKDVDDFASTKHKGKPEKVKREQRVRNLIKKMVREELNKINETTVRISKMKDVSFAGRDRLQLVGKKGKLGLDRKSVSALAKAVRSVLGRSFTTHEAKLNEAKMVTLPNGVKVKIEFKGITLQKSGKKPVFLDRTEMMTFFKATQKYMKQGLAAGKVSEGTCGYGENGELGEEPAGPHLIKKKMKEEVEPIGGMAKIAKIVKDKQHAKVGGQTVDMQSANLLMKLYNAVKDKDKEKMNKMSEKKLIMVLGKLWSRVKLKLPT
tara:strand:- start:230 stop:1129 length:900 start_codon:yes stop_codon:yes gene_type:complete